LPLVRRPTTSSKLKLGYVALAAADTWLSGRSATLAHRARFVTKPLLMPVLAASLATNERAAGSPLRTSTLVAQVGGWGGDVALLANGTKPFLAGTGSFGLGHLAYVAGFLRRRDHSPVREDTSVKVVAGSWALTAPVMAFLAGRQHRELGGPVLGYATLLAAMTAAASHLDPTVPASARRLTAAGAALFMLSDSMLGFRKFALTDPPPELETAVMATYTAAQFLLSEGAARA
jgi:uncharacterized membrane protein YhhN